jgi:hypothetical protein
VNNFPVKIDSQIVNAYTVIKIEGKTHIALLSVSGDIYFVSPEGKIIKTVNTQRTPSRGASLNVFKSGEKEHLIFTGSDKRIVFTDINGAVNNKINIYGSKWLVLSDADNDGYTEILSYAYDNRLYFYRILSTER